MNISVEDFEKNWDAITKEAGADLANIPQQWAMEVLPVMNGSEKLDKWSVFALIGMTLAKNPTTMLKVALMYGFRLGMRYAEAKHLEGASRDH